MYIDSFSAEVVEPTVGVQPRKDRWNVRRPFQVITSKLIRRPTGAGQRHQQLKYVNLSEQHQLGSIYPDAFSTTRSIIPVTSALEDVYKSTRRPSNRQADSSGRLNKVQPTSSTLDGQLFIDEEEEGERPRGQWEGPEVSKSNAGGGGGTAHSRHSSLISTAVAVPNINHVYSRVPSVALYETPIFEQDSYLEALQLSRLPCQLLKDPDDCFDSTQLFRQRHKDEAPASKKLLATIRILINFHEKYPHLSTFV